MRYTLFFAVAVMLLLGGWLLIADPVPGTETATTTNSTASTTISSDWSVYTNTRFGYRISYPADLVAKNPPQNNGGRVFTNASGTVNLRVFGSHNVLNQTLRDVVSEETSQFSSLYQAEVGSTSATIAGRVALDQLRQVKILRGQDNITIARLTYASDALSAEVAREIVSSLAWEDVDGQTTTDKRPVSYTPEEAKRLITVSSPTQEMTISSPLIITGEARGQWYFEATAPVVLTDWDGRIIAESYIQAEGEWMTEEFVPFSGELTFNVPTSGDPAVNRGTLILERSNPSGLPENNASVEIPVRFAN